MPVRRTRPGRATRLSLEQDLASLRLVEQSLRDQNEELVESQALLEDARDDFAELYNWAPSPLVTLAPPGTIRSANLATAELFERERSWLVGRAFRMLFRPGDREALATCLTASGGYADCTAWLVLPDESLAAVRLTRRFSLKRSGVLHVALTDLRRLHPPRSPHDPARNEAGHRILLVEDHLETAEAMQEVLERNGYRVVSADSIETATSVDLAGVDAIVSDILLPDGRGTQLISQLKRERSVPAIAFSGLTRQSDIDGVKAAGFDLFFTKPVDFPRLLKALGNLLEPRSPGPSAHAGD
jgi:CheY-like chemotaxis protein